MKRFAMVVALLASAQVFAAQAQTSESGGGYSKTAAPLVVKGQIVTGIAGGEYGIRGFLDSYNAASGELEWRTHTIPGPDHPDNQTWAGDSWRTGGSPTWITGAYDPDLNLVYWGTGNPGPDWNGDVRMGDNLYADSALALNGDTGEMEWYFQFTPHDMHDWDAIQVPILADLQMGGGIRKVMMWANRNAFYYTLDRETGEFLVGEPFARQTWAERLDTTGRPIRRPDTSPSVEGTVVSPPVGGGTNWFSPSFSPRTELFYVMAFDSEAEYYIRDDTYEEGRTFTGGGSQSTGPMDHSTSAVRAIDPKTGARRWEYQVQPRSTAGVLSTAGALVFSGSVDGYFYALDAVSGRELWHIAVGGRVHAAPMSFAVDSTQYVTIAAGNVVYTFGLRD